MSLGKLAGTFACAILSVTFSGCGGGGSSSDSSNTLTSVVQDLSVDPEGATTVLTFASTEGLSGANSANFESDDGQAPLNVGVTGSTVTIGWDARVTPSSRVRAVGLSDVTSSYHAVTASDTSASTFTVTSGTQNAGLGGDLIHIAFDGPHVLGTDVENPTHWVLSIDDTVLDLTGTTIVFTPSTQTATFTLGTMANLHATFSLHASGIRSVADVAISTASVDGTATGDMAAPTLTSVTQNLAEDEFGRVVDFTFSEAMDPTFATQLSHFDVPAPDIATEVTQPSENVLRVAFNNPIVPGTNQVTLTGIVDCHGNAFADGAQVVTQPSPVVNSFDGAPAATTVANAGGDTITVVTTQALDPDSAILPASWSILVGGVPVDLSTQTLDYDLLTKTFTVVLDFDLQNGVAFTVTGVAAKDIDGQTFTLSSGSSVAGDAVAPTIVSATQNRNIDSTGATVVVQLSEDVDPVAAENGANWSISGTAQLQAAVLGSGLDSVELVFNDVVVPGDVTLGFQNVKDLAGNVATSAIGIAIGSTDSTRPAASTAFAAAIAGANNDTVAVVFDDDMIASEVEVASNWTIESPVATGLATLGATVDYDTSTRTATFAFSNGINLLRGDNFKVTLAGCRDIGANVITSASITGVVDAEMTLPEVHAVYRDAVTQDELVVQFTEPCGKLVDLYNATTNPTGTRYVLRDSFGVQRGLPITATVLDDGLGVRLAYGIVIASSDTLDVLGVTDLTGNPMFPALGVATVAEDTTTPSLHAGFSAFTSSTGENNDAITVAFDRPMSPWKLLDPTNYVISGPSAFSLASTVLTFDGDRTVTIGLRGQSGHNLQTGSSYTLAVNGVWSAQGVERTSVDTQSGIIASGDATTPVVPVGKVRLDPSDSQALLIEADEALDIDASAVASSFDYDAGNLATGAERIGPRTIRATFATMPTIGHNVQLALQDLAGNVTGAITRAVTAADTAGPLVSGVAGIIRPGLGGDVVTITYNEPVTGVTGLVAGNYAISSGGTVLNLTNARISYASSTNTVSILLQEGQELDANASISVTVGNVRDFSGNAMAAQIQVGGSVTGDTTAPSISKSFVNLRAASNGTQIDVLFSEDVDTSYAGLASHWSASGGPTITSVTMLERNHARVQVSAALGAAQTLAISSVPDLARNLSGALSTNPTE